MISDPLGGKPPPTAAREQANRAVYRGLAGAEAGTLEQPGRHVRVKSILDQGWFEFRRQLSYKLAWQGDWLVVVPPQNTTRTCPCCGHVSGDNRQTQGRFLGVA
nr:zinc ribbon domain-containing protein [uncultured Thermosynechococcus sp.]